MTSAYVPLNRPAKAVEESRAAIGVCPTEGVLTASRETRSQTKTEEGGSGGNILERSSQTKQR